MLGKLFQRPDPKAQDDSTPQNAASAKTKIEVGAIVEQRYRLDAEIGRGGMGVVFRAHDMQLDRDVAFKVAYLGDGMGGTREQFLHEARITTQLKHPHIVSVYETGEVDTGAPQTSPFMVMELIRGGSLDGLRGLSFAQIIDLGRQICDALAYAHDQGLVHRDLKPNNVLVEKHGYRYIAKLMDFGLARDLSELSTQTGIAGTVYYIAPEVIEGKPAEIAADLYALGAMLYEMVTGHVPFSDFDEQGILSQHLKESVVPPSDTRSDIPFALESIVLRLLAKNPQDRFASACEVSDALAQVVPAPESIAALNNLPRFASNFVGREKEIADLKQLIEANRAVALVGAGGVGKTRLALATAESLIGQFVDGIWLIDFAPWNDPSLVPQIVATALGVREQARCTLVVSLMEQLRSKEMLLVLDQCDRMNYACVQLAETILQACPTVRLILTSRLPLHLSSAVVYHVPSLNTSDAEKLFREHLPKLSDQDAPMFTQVCQQLGGIPLAIELVAARAHELLLTQVNEHLMRLEAENGAALWRDQATRAIVGWSYDLLSLQAQDLLNRLSVFIGGFTLAAVESFSGIGTLDTEKLLNQLISVSLVDVGPSNTGETRYRLLEPIRQLAFGKLQEAGTEESMSRSHRDGYFLLAMQAEPKLHGVEQGIWLKRLETEYANVIAALDWTIDHPVDVTIAFRFGGALWQFWNERDYWSDVRRRLERILGLEYTPNQALARAPVLVGAGYLALRAADHRTAQDYFDQALATTRDTQDYRSQAFALCGLGSIAQAQRDVPRATELYREGWKKFEGAGNPWETANALLNLAIASLRQNDVHEARKLFSASLNGFRHIGDKKRVVQVLTHLGLLAYDQQHYTDASHLFHEALDVSRGLSNKLSTATLLRHLGYAALHQEHHTQAHQYFCQALMLFKEINQRSSIADVLFGIAGALAQRHIERAAQLIGAAEMLLQIRGEPNAREEQDRRWVIDYVPCDTESLQAARHAGTLVSLEQALDLATQRM